VIPGIKITVNDTSAMRTVEAAQRTEFLNSALREVANFAHQQVMAMTPGKGNIRGRWRIVYVQAMGGTIRTVYIQNTYEPARVLEYLEFGTRPHKIYPRDPSGRLVFFWEREGRMFIGAPGQGVSHPGNIPYKMVDLTYQMIEANMNRFTDLFEFEFERQVAQAGG
jgi:hypothetical protein